MAEKCDMPDTDGKRQAPSVFSIPACSRHFARKGLYVASWDLASMDSFYYGPGRGRADPLARLET